MSIELKFLSIFYHIFHEFAEKEKCSVLKLFSIYLLILYQM